MFRGFDALPEGFDALLEELNFTDSSRSEDKKGFLFPSKQTTPDLSDQSSSPITPQEAEAMIKGKLAPEHHYLINDTHVQLAMAYEGDFGAVYHAGPPERIEITRAKVVDQSSLSTSLRAGERPVTSDELGGIDMNVIDLERQGAGMDIQFDPIELQQIIDVGIDGFAPVIINITPLPSILPFLGLEPANKEEGLEVSSLN